MNAFEIGRLAARGTATVTSSGAAGWQHFLSPDPNAPILIMRSGAIGDLLMLTPALAARKKKSSRKIALSCFAHHNSIFDHSDLVDELVPYPFPLERLKEFSEVIDLGNVMEMDHTQPAQDIFAKALGVSTPLTDYRPSYVITIREILAGKKHLFTGRPNLAVQPVASIPNRNYPADLLVPALMKLEQRGWGIIILGRKGQVQQLPPQLNTPYVRNLSVHDLPLRDSVAVLNSCTAFLGPDSSFMHFAAALNVPSVSLHGPFPWQIRAHGYPRNIALAGKGDCAGCCWHLHGGNVFPPNKPCSATGRCVVLAEIDPDRIVAKIDALK